MNSMLKTGVMGAIAAVFVASVAVAGGQEPQQRRGPGMRGPGGPGGRGMAPIMRELTEEQRKQVRAILDEQSDDQQGQSPVGALGPRQRVLDR